MNDRLFIFEESIKKLSDIDNKTHRIIDNYKPNTATEYEDKKNYQHLKGVKSYILDFYLNHETISKVTKKCQSQILDKVLRKYSKRNISVGVTKYYHDETIKHSKSETKESIAERVKLNPRKIKKQKPESKC